MATQKKFTINDGLRGWLLQQRRKTVTLDAMQAAFPRMAYAAFRAAVAALETDGVLVPVKASGTDAGGLARKYTIHPGPLLAATAARIQHEAIALGITGALDLSWYLAHPYDAWQQDRAAIESLSRWCNRLPCPPSALPKTSLQQRSYDIFGDEKYLLAHGELLPRLNLSRDALAIAPEADPLMMAFHPLAGSVHHHLIVENKAPWMALASHLAETGFTSLVLGYGWKISASIDALPMQSGYPCDTHVAWYFGDFDWEGLRIWHELRAHAAVDVRLAAPFYAAFLAHPASTGKDAQAPAPEALDAFLAAMPDATRERFRETLMTSHYYPQEALTASELLACCKETLSDGT